MMIRIVRMTFMLIASATIRGSTTAAFSRISSKSSSAIAKRFVLSSSSSKAATASIGAARLPFTPLSSPSLPRSPITTASTTASKPTSTSSALMMSTSAGQGQAEVNMKHISKAQMEDILEDYEELGRDGTNIVVIDVRTPDEVAATGKLSPSVHTLPVQIIMQRNIFQLDDEEFEEQCGFPKPKPDETLVFTCAAGIRSVYACQFAAQAGYTNLVNYAGGANEWFSPY